MTTTFLTAIKQKSEADKSKLVPSTPLPPVVLPPSIARRLGVTSLTPIARIQMPQLANFSASPLYSDNMQAVTPEPIPEPMPEPTPEPILTVRIEVVANRNRLDVYFSAKPSADIREYLKRKSFRFNDDRLCWYNQDNQINRNFLTQMFNAQFDEPYISDEIETPKTTETTELEVKHEAFTSQKFELYKEQVNQLSLKLQVDPADLMILAVSALYDKTFNIM